MTRTPFPDPYEGMSAEELDRHFSDLIIDNRQRQRAISIRFPEDLLGELRQLADQAGIPYQTLIKLLLERDVASLRPNRPGVSRRTVRLTAERTAKPNRAANAAKLPRTASAERAGKKATNPGSRVPS